MSVSNWLEPVRQSSDKELGWREMHTACMLNIYLFLIHGYIFHMLRFLEFINVSSGRVHVCGYKNNLNCIFLPGF